jgi:hypothetical protein
MPSFNDSLLTAIKPEVKENFSVAAMLLFSILQKNKTTGGGGGETQQKLDTFSKIYYHTSIENLKLHITSTVLIS